jgi:TM2 domain-containing membrane protein YozV
MRYRAWVFFMLLGLAGRGWASGPFVPGPAIDMASIDSLYRAAPSPPEAGRTENARLVGSALAVALGPFGAHRLYMGTTPRVAVAYGLTFGGFGVLVLLDLGHLLFSKDLAPYRDNGRVFMWNRPQGVTPP